jgi:hypothetical protein
MPQVFCRLLGLVALGALWFLPSTTWSLEDAAPAPSVKIAIPDIAAQRNARKQINDTFATDIAKAKKPGEKAAIAKQLFQAGKESRNDPAGKYEMLSTARELAVAGGDADTALAAITELDEYAIDAVKLKTDALAAILKSTVNSQDALGIAANVGPLVDEALAAGRYTVARQLAELAVSAARSAKDADALAQANKRLDEVRDVEAASGPAAKAAVILSTKPHDPAASLTLGRFEAFLKGNWEKGLPLLASGSDSTLKDLAQSEFLAANNADKLALVADGWWAASERERGVARAHLRGHAAKWYKLVLPKLSALAKIKAEKRLRESSTVQMAHAGWTDLLKRASAESDTVSGKWTFVNGTLSAGIDPPARFTFHKRPQDPYEVQIQYVQPMGGRHILGVYLPVGNSDVTLYVTPPQIGLDLVEGKFWDGNETTRTGSFGGDKNKHVLNIAVWPGEQVRIIVLFDGKPAMDWSGASSKLSVRQDFTLPAPMPLGVFTYQAAPAIYGFAVREIADMPQPPPSKK